MFERIQKMGTADGLAFNVEAIDVAPNTADAHRLILWAQDREKGTEMATALFQAYFSEGKDVSSPEGLADAAADVGFDTDAVEALLGGDAYADAVRDSQQQAQRQGITGVPCYVFNQQHAVMGAQSVEVLTEALDAASE